MGVGITFGMRFGGTSGFGGMGWANRHADADEFKALWMTQPGRHADIWPTNSSRPSSGHGESPLPPHPAGSRGHVLFSRRHDTAKQIAEHLELSPKTIANIWSAPARTMEAVSTMEAVAKALIYELIG